MTLPHGAELRRLCARALVVGTVAARRFARHRMPTYAAALAYRGALALFPFLLLVFGLANAVGLEVITSSLAARAAAQRPEEQGALARWLTAQIEEPPSGGLISIGVITALWAVAAGIRNLRQALAIAADAPDPAERPMWKRILLSMSVSPLVVAAVIAAAASLLVTSRAIELVAGWLGADGGFAGLFAWLRVPIALVLVTLLLAAAYWFAPVDRPSFRSVLPGAVLAALGWTVMSLGFSIALATVLDYGATYGSFGAAIGLLVYLHFSAAAVLAGAEVNAALGAEGEGRPRPVAEQLPRAPHP